VLAEEQSFGVRSFQNLLKSPFPFSQWKACYVLAVEVKKIEGIGDDLSRIAAFSKGILQLLKAAPPICENDSFHVNYCVFDL
jgi:hypothetical protein